jgi:hypothetical protein
MVSETSGEHRDRPQLVGRHLAEAREFEIDRNLLERHVRLEARRSVPGDPPRMADGDRPNVGLRTRHLHRPSRHPPIPLMLF